MLRSLLLSLLMLASPARAALPDTVAQALEQAGIADSHLGVVVLEADGTPLLQHGMDAALNPASVMKLLTTLAALDRLGPGHTFKTSVWLDGALQDGVLQGNLVLQGGGDPGMTPERLWLLLRELRQRGLREIRGDILIDNRFYALDEPATAFDQTPLRPYNAAPAALLVNYNVHTLRLRSREPGVELQLDPAPAAGMRIDNRLSLSNTACNAWSDQIATRIEAGALVVEGRYPAACGERTLPLNLDTPVATASAWISTLWQELGGRLAGAVRNGEGSATATLLFAQDSLPLQNLVRDTNKFSNNVMAKMLFLNMGAARFGAPATWPKGERAMRLWAAERGLMLPKSVIENGSGLSRIERLTAGSLAELLRWAMQQPAYYEFAASLPAVGIDGTQKNRFAGSALSGRAWLKSGSLNVARNFAGYVMGPDGQRRVVVWLLNHPRAGLSSAAQDALLIWAMVAPNRGTESPKAQ